MTEYDFYDTELHGIELLKDGQEVVIPVRDRETMTSQVVRAVVSQSQERLPDGVRLHIYGRLGVPIESSWYIKVLEEIDDEALETRPEDVEHLDPELALKSPEAAPRARRIPKRKQTSSS